MRKLLLLLCVLAATQFSASAQDQKFGHLNVQELMLQMPERSSAEAKLKEFAETLDTRLKAMGEEYQNKLAEAQKNEANMTNTEKEFVLTELAELEDRITKAQRKSQEDIAKQEQELLQPMVERAQNAINAVAKANGFSYIFDSSTGIIPYFDGGIDVSDLVKTELSKSTPKVAPATPPGQ